MKGEMHISAVEEDISGGRIAGIQRRHPVQDHPGEGRSLRPRSPIHAPRQREAKVQHRAHQGQRHRRRIARIDRRHSIHRHAGDARRDIYQSLQRPELRPHLGRGCRRIRHRKVRIEGHGRFEI